MTYSYSEFVCFLWMKMVAIEQNSQISLSITVCSAYLKAFLSYSMSFVLTMFMYEIFVK